MKNGSKVLVFVHGWSVTNTATYGALPERLKTEAKRAGMDVIIEEIFLGRYISFQDEVRLEDIARGFQTAVTEQLSPLLNKQNRFICITHSTGGPVIRDWWHRYYKNLPGNKRCPMSHLIMLAPANYGSALAQLGKGRLSRIKAWFDGIEPGQAILDWLELGSQASWKLNKEWIHSASEDIAAGGIFPFVLTGQSIDRAFYDNLNTYTGESGSDGVIRVASANLQSRYIRLVQQPPKPTVADNQSQKEWQAPLLTLESSVESPAIALRIIGGKSHSGKQMGIMASVKKSPSDKNNAETIKALLDCIRVRSKTRYQQLVKRFNEASARVQAEEQLEILTNLLLPDEPVIHDRYSMVIFRVRDHKGYAVKDFDLILTAGETSDPNHLPKGFFVDKQRNSLNPEVISYFFNYDIMKGSEAIVDGSGNIIRKKIPGARGLGIKIIPRPQSGFVHYQPCEIKASDELLEKMLVKNSTTLVDICLRRLVHKNIMVLDEGSKAKSFKNTRPSGDFVD